MKWVSVYPGFIQKQRVTTSNPLRVYVTSDVLPTGAHIMQVYIDGIARSTSQTNGSWINLNSNINLSEGEHTISIHSWNVAGQRLDPNFDSKFWVVSNNSRFKNPFGDEIIKIKEGNGTIKKPVLVVEGFDPGNMTDIIDIKDLMSSFIDNVTSYDIYVLNFKNGGRDLRDNAMTVLGTLTYLKAQYSGQNCEGIKLIGISMGGVIGRYALAVAEENNVNHYCSEFISCDSPQRGAVINYDFQSVINDCANNDEITSSTDKFLVMNASLNSTAAKQLLRNNYLDSPSNDEYITGGYTFRKFFSEINCEIINPDHPTLPKVNDSPSNPKNKPGFAYKYNNIKNFAISNGKVERSGNLGNEPYLVEWDAGNSDYDVSPKPYDTQSGSTLGLLNAEYQNAYWIFGIWQVDFDAPSYDPVFVPTKSSLYLSTPNNPISDLTNYNDLVIPSGQNVNTYLSTHSKFDEVVIQPSNKYEHAYVSTTTVNAILNWINNPKYNNTGFISGTITGNSYGNVKIETFLGVQLLNTVYSNAQGQYEIPYPFINSANLIVKFTKNNCYEDYKNISVAYNPASGSLSYTPMNVSINQISLGSIHVNTDPAVSAFRTIQDAINYVQIQCSPTEQKTFNVIVQNNTTWNENVVIGNLTNANLNIRGFGNILSPSSIYTNVNTSGGIPFDIDLNVNCNIKIIGFSIQNNQLGVLIRSSNENCTFFVNDCKFLNNTNTFWTRDFAGSAIHSQFPVDVTDCVFSNNQAQWAPEYSSNNSGFGSAIYMIAKSGTVNITNNQFLQNSGKTSAVYVAGTSTEKNAIINMTGNTFKENRLIKSQNNIHNPDDFVSITVQYANSLNFEKNLIAKEKNDNNTCLSSAFVGLSNLKIINNTFAENNVTAFEIYSINSSPKISNNILSRNVSNGYAGLIYLISNSPATTSSNNVSYQNKYYNGTTNITTLPTGFTNLDPIIYLSTEGENAFHPKWTTREISPCIDKGNPDTNDNGVVWYLDTDDQDSDGSRKDIGALPAVFHKNDRFSYRPLDLKNYINWISLPALNMLTSNKNKFNSVFSEATPGNFQRFWSENNGSLDHNVINTGTNIFNPYYIIQRNLGYKLSLNDSLTIETSGDKLPDNTRVYLQENQSGWTQYPEYNWVGYFVDKPMTPWQAFAPVLDNIDEIKHKNWSTVKNPDGTWTNQNTPTWLISYGEMVMVHCIKECDLILGNNNQYPQYSAPRQTAQSFDYMEKDDYIPLYVDLNTESKSMPSEIGFYVNGFCKGAAVVDNDVVEINAYVLDDSTDYSTAEISFVLHNDSKSAPKEVKIYSLYNSNEKKFVNQSLDMNDHQRYYTVKLNDIPEVQYETTLQGNYPNPFNPSTTIRFSLKNDSKVELSVYNVKGQKVRSLTQSMLEKGNHNIVWNGKDQNGQSCSSGVYFYKLKIDNKVLTRKMLMVK